ncbi:MAG: tail tube [Wendovervirus sonii]|uniref:Tail tube n=1 Tax=phage Lak_Megaphage_Sonny TaxID=3109229 RepID=A0ABZ0Z248_9CAUD|nr:MAG: tail tube [phage Lak_Megaphage_Sonny]
MILNPLSQNFAIWMPANFFYNEVVNLWMPVFKRKFLPYITIEDMFASQITGINFPSITVNNVTQGLQNYQITKRGGRQLDHEMDKTVTLTVKLSEAYMTYFIARQQMELFLKYGENQKDLYMGPLNITILDEGGFENITYTYYQLTPNNLSDFDLSYSAQFGQFKTFTWGFKYNYFDIFYRDENGDRKKFNLDTENGMLHDPIIPDLKDNNKAITRDKNIERLPINKNSMLR